MEPEVREFLQRISSTIGLTALWMFINVIIGIWFNLAFIHGRVTTGNIIFYIWFAASIVLLIWLYIRVWRNKAS